MYITSNIGSLEHPQGFAEFGGAAVDGFTRIKRLVAEGKDLLARRSYPRTKNKIREIATVNNSLKRLPLTPPQKEVIEALEDTIRVAGIHPDISQMRKFFRFATQTLDRHDIMIEGGPDPEEAQSTRPPVRITTTTYTPNINWLTNAVTTAFRTVVGTTVRTPDTTTTATASATVNQADARRKAAEAAALAAKREKARRATPAPAVRTQLLTAAARRLGVRAPRSLGVRAPRRYTKKVSWKKASTRARSRPQRPSPPPARAQRPEVTPSGISVSTKIIIGILVLGVASGAIYLVTQ